MPHPREIFQTTVIVLNWNGGFDTVQCLRSLTKLDDEDFNVIVVDNNSIDDSIAQIIDEMQAQARDLNECFCDVDAQTSKLLLTLPKFTLLRSSENGGFAAGNNQGINLAISHGAKYLWILNNDVEVHPRALRELLTVCRASPTSIVGSTLVYHDARCIIQCVGGVKFDLDKAAGEQIGQGSSWTEGAQIDEPKNLSYIAGASMLATADLLQKLGGFEERYFLYFEEFDLALRLEQSGTLRVATSSVVFHKEGASIGTASRSKRSVMSQYYMTRNLVIFYKLHFPDLVHKAQFRLLREFIKCLIRGDWRLAGATFQAAVDATIGRVGQRLWI